MERSREHESSLGGYEHEFERAAEQLSLAVAAGHANLTDAQKLRLYALFKQASDGDCVKPQPSERRSCVAQDPLNCVLLSLTCATCIVLALVCRCFPADGARLCVIGLCVLCGARSLTHISSLSRFPSVSRREPSGAIHSSLPHSRSLQSRI